MRWFWIDRFDEFVRGNRASAIKNVTLSEEPLDEYLPGNPHYPHSLIVEGLAQTGGLLIAELGEFRNRVVLAKLGNATFHRPVYPGDQLRLTAEIQNLQSSGAIVSGKVTVNGVPQADMEVSFAFLDDRFGKDPLFPPADLLRTLRCLRVYDVAVDENGVRITPPQYMLDAERAQQYIE